MILSCIRHLGGVLRRDGGPAAAGEVAGGDGGGCAAEGGGAGGLAVVEHAEPDGDPGGGVAAGQRAADRGVGVHRVHLARHHAVKQTVLTQQGQCKYDP